MKEENKLHIGASNVKITALPQSEIEITGTIAVAELQTFYTKALKHLNDHVEIDGFRKGNVPEKILISKVGEMAVLEEMAELALAKHYPLIVEEHKLNVIGRPHIQIIKLAKDIPLEFKIKVAIVPEIKLADYKKIAKEHLEKKAEKIAITEKDIEDVIMQVRKSRVDHTGHDHSGNKEEHDKAIETSLPEFNDQFVQSLGDFKNVDDFKEKIKESLALEKDQKAKEKKRIEIAEAIIEGTKIDLPSILVEHELDKLGAQFADDIARMGVKIEDYLKHIKKTLEELRNDWRKDAEKKAKFSLILNEIAAKEKIAAEKSEVDKEVGHILNHYKDADPERARKYATSLLTNEKVFQFLESMPPAK